ncbi:MAG: hypothetical protein methR_P1576 [Methyloprofundus sp.]|nr:MAG: hypothetical protein methR_P1576 [Methyloprofundus sp.]
MKTSPVKLPKETRIICLPFSRTSYPNIVETPELFRHELDEKITRFPELFPKEIEQGYLMKDSRVSKHLKLLTRRIKVGKYSYTIRPSFVTPYWTGFVDDVEKALFLRKFAVPFWALTYVFGHSDMYWYRLEQHIGHVSIVGTTVRNPDGLPEHLVADEKHSKDRGEKCYVATTCGSNCVFGASIAMKADEASLTDAYGVFKTEARQLKADYQPKTVNTDGWSATILAWQTLFSGILIIACFLHIYIKLRDRAKVKFKALFGEVADKLWDCYKSPTKASFSQRLRQLDEWLQAKEAPDFMQERVAKMRVNKTSFTAAYDYSEAHRTSNAVDRLMGFMDRYLFATRYFHGKYWIAAEYSIRSWALIYNFAPSNPATVRLHHGLKSPAECLNQFRYHENWLQNLLISSSQKGVFVPPLNAR